MELILLLPWFPIIIAVAVAGGLLGRTRGLAIGFCCALFWIVVVQATAGIVVWSHGWIAIALVVGAIAIIAMGGWAGESALIALKPSATSLLHLTRKNESDSANETIKLQKISTLLDSFDDWLDEHRNDSNPWPAFGEFIRTALYQCCKATHVKPYRLAGHGNELWPLREEADLFTEIEPVSARRGIAGHVVTSGRPYVSGDKQPNELTDRLTGDSNNAIAWCFAIHQGTRKLGCVTVGQLDISPQQNRALFKAVEKMMRHCWCMLMESLMSRSAVDDDPISGVYARNAFIRIIEQSVQDSYKIGEPVAIAVFSVEGLRKLDDSGHWEIADQLIGEISRLLKRRVRIDDKLGRFNSSQFMLLLRRVDSELASLIVNQLMAKLTELCNDNDRWPVPVEVRCAVVGSGTEQPDLRTLISRALNQSRQSRVEQSSITTDLLANDSLNEVHA